MKVALAAIRYPPAPGGAETHVAALADGLVKRGHDVVVHTSDLFTEYPFARRELPTEINGVRIVRHKAQRWLGSWTAMPSMDKALRDERADILHAHSYGYYQTVSAARVARRAGSPFVFTPHFHPPWSMEGGALRRALRGVFDPMVGQPVVNAADRVVFVSSGERAEMKRHLRVPDERSVVIPNGFYPERFDPIPKGALFRDRYKIGASERLVVFAGRLASNKGLTVLVDAFSQLEAKNTRLVLAGEDQGWSQRLVEQATRLGVADRLVFTGHLDDATYRSCLAASDVFVLPSEWEAFGIVLAEAMACGVPCVATRVGGAPDVVKEGVTGRLVEFGDARALARALDSVLADRLVAFQLGAAGRLRALREFSWSAVVDRTVKLYEELV